MSSAGVWEKLESLVPEITSDLKAWEHTLKAKTATMGLDLLLLMLIIFNK